MQHYVVNHNLGSRNIIINVYDERMMNITLYCTLLTNTPDAIEIWIPQEPDLGVSFTVEIKGVKPMGSDLLGIIGYRQVLLQKENNEMATTIALNSLETVWVTTYAGGEGRGTCFDISMQVNGNTQATTTFTFEELYDLIISRGSIRGLAKPVFNNTGVMA